MLNLFIFLPAHNIHGLVVVVNTYVNIYFGVP